MSSNEIRIDELLRALSNTTRRKILSIVWKQRRSAGEISSELDLADASVSEHLKVLRKAKLVSVQREGTYWYYEAERKSIFELTKLLNKQFPK